LVWFKVSNLIIPLRSKEADEIQGLDLPEMGAEAYPDYALTDGSSPAEAQVASSQAVLSK
jgi:Amt family ammonium transporter